MTNWGGVPTKVVPIFLFGDHNHLVLYIRIQMQSYIYTDFLVNIDIKRCIEESLLFKSRKENTVCII